MKKVEIVCNLCGKKFDVYDIEEGININTTLTYNSKYDNSRVDMDICCECMDKLIDHCTISPISEE